MTKARNDYIYEFQGTILSQQPAQPSPTSKYAGKPYYKLYTNLENQPNKVLQAFPDKLFNPQIWEAIEQGQCLQKKYLFKCRNQRGFYYLVDWEELPKEEIN